MTMHTVVFGGAAAARNGLTAMPVNPGEDFFKITNVNFLTNNTGKTLYILGYQLISAAIANVADHQFHLSDETDISSFTVQHMRDQAGPYTPDLPSRGCKAFPDGKQLAVEVNNGNNSQVDIVVMFISDNPAEIVYFSPDHALLVGYQWFRFTMGTTVVAAVLTPGALTAVNFFPDDGAIYDIKGAGGIAATGIHGRIKHKSGGTEGIRPGFDIGDIATPAKYRPVYADFGKFKGDTYPDVQQLSVAADTAAEIYLLIKKVN